MGRPLDIVFCGTGWLPMVDHLRERLPAEAKVRVRDYTKPIAEAVASANVILPSNARIDAAAIAAPKDLILIQQPAVGIEVVDLQAAKDRGIPVCNVPGVNADAVAQTALLLMLAVARRLPEARRKFETAEIGVPLGRELSGKVLGVIGLGKIGSKLARAGEALGMEVMSVRSQSTRQELERLLDRSDFVSLHCPLTPATRGILGEAEIARMKKGSVVINCARGALIDREALEQALRSGHLGGAGLDVFWAEPWDPADPLYARDDVVTLPHVGGSTFEVFSKVADTCVENIRRVLAGEPLLHRIV
jgi:phosphoglycerate dehydrogenase-like enzyme